MKTDFNYKIKILNEKQGNPYYDPTKTNNGGGYDQSIITFLVNGKKGVFKDNSCGDFGWRLCLKVEGEGYWGYNNMDDSSCHFPAEYWEGIKPNKIASILKQLGYGRFGRDIENDFKKISRLNNGELAIYMGKYPQIYKGFTIYPGALIGRNKKGQTIVCYDVFGQEVQIYKYIQGEWKKFHLDEWEWNSFYKKEVKYTKNYLYVENTDALLFDWERLAKKKATPEQKRKGVVYSTEWI